jgi:hypothetical protein
MGIMVKYIHKSKDGVDFMRKRLFRILIIMTIVLAAATGMLPTVNGDDDPEFKGENTTRIIVNI